VASRRLELGFEGGSVLRITVEEAAAQQLTGALGTDPGWHAIEADEGTFWVNRGELRYVRMAPGDAPSRVGFGGS
jgi:hypothetical protein